MFVMRRCAATVSSGPGDAVAQSRGPLAVDHMYTLHSSGHPSHGLALKLHAWLSQCCWCLSCARVRAQLGLHATSLLSLGPLPLLLEEVVAQGHDLLGERAGAGWVLTGTQLVRAVNALLHIQGIVDQVAGCG